MQLRQFNRNRLNTSDDYRIIPSKYSNTNNTLASVTTKRRSRVFALLLRIREVPVLNTDLDTGYPDSGFTWFFLSISKQVSG